MGAPRKNRPAVVVGNVAYITLTNGKVAVVDAIDADLGERCWFAVKSRNAWYAGRSERIQGRKAPVHVSLHRVVAERAGYAIDELEVDHEDGDGLNCRRGNLRPANDAQNAWNRRRHRNNTSGFSGVRWRPERSRWVALISAAGKRRCLGHFVTAVDAWLAYATAAKAARGRFAHRDVSTAALDR
jgi:hypothetical protein